MASQASRFISIEEIDRRYFPSVYDEHVEQSRDPSDQTTDRVRDSIRRIRDEMGHGTDMRRVKEAAKSD